ncbi:hypothetical protein GCM10025876_25010 [Demequina litorisediminis]|uniref:Phosphoketolase n=1 Tax=Demequina litorisediminis TaxID=1849022 RepID=A0ABQ6IEI4_9MICO|nr:hypothetical protein GCM10025876_25010 [Demequina litorisediminis]
MLDVTDKVWQGRREDDGAHTGPSGRVIEMLSEHQCQGWLEGYLLTGRHGLFTSYEAFIHIVDSMFNQHAKWLKVSQEPAVAPSHRLAELLVVEPRVASGPQRLLSPGPRLHRPRGQQEGGGGARVPARRCQHSAQHLRPLLALARLHQRRCRG